MPRSLPTTPLTRLLAALALVAASFACSSDAGTSEDGPTLPFLDVGVRVDAGSDAGGSEDAGRDAGGDIAEDAAPFDAGEDPADAGADAAPDDIGAPDGDASPQDAGDASSGDADDDTTPPDTADASEDAGACEAAGDACDDGDPCTTDDRCDDGGVCVGAPVICPASAEACSVSVCEEGLCVSRTLPDLSTCDDDDPCTDGDSCFAGTCAGVPRMCPGGDGICSFAVCSPDSGDCTVEKLDDGTACDDGDVCTLADTCVDGFCVGASDEAAGTRCDDGDACTGDDRCEEGGTCIGNSLLDCSDLDDACTVGACVVGWETLECAAVPVLDGLRCDEGFCLAGACSVCAPDAFDPDDDVAAGARPASDAPSDASLCPGDVDYLSARPRAGRAIGVAVVSEAGCAGGAELAWMNEDGEMEADRSTRAGCPVAIVEDATTLRLSATEGFVPAYSLDTAVFLPEREPNGTRDEARRIDALAGWDWAGRIEGAADEDWFVLELAEPRRVTVETGGFACGVDTVLTLLTADARTVVTESDDASGLDRCSRLELVLPDGTWYLRVRGYDALASGRYTFSLRTEAAPVLAAEEERNDVREAANGPWSVPVRIEGELGYGDEDWFAVTAPAPGVLVAYTDDGFGGCAADTVLDWAGPDGAIALTNDDEPSRGLCSELRVPIEAPGTSWFRVTGFGERTTGPYVLTVTTER